MNKRLRRPENRRGFTLIEIMVVVVILGILAAVVVPRMFGRVDEARITKAKADIKAIEGALAMYRLDNGVFPSTEQGLMALVQKPTSSPEPRKWNPEGYLKKLPKDPWDRDYLYLSPGSHGDFDLLSLGADGEVGGQDNAADLNNWELD